METKVNLTWTTLPVLAETSAEAKQKARLVFAADLERFGMTPEKAREFASKMDAEVELL